VGRDGRARVGDFGLAAGQGAERAGGGTPAYAPPETALALAELASGKDNPQVLTYHAALAMALQSTGDFEGAEASVLRARAFALHKHGPGGDLPPGGGGTSRPSPMPRARSPRRSST
jgi:hypothetical protein